MSVTGSPNPDSRRLAFDQAKIRVFRRLVRAHYRRHGRDLPWRRTRDPFRILVSEFMLQQTQVERVRTKYLEFLKAFPTLRALAAAPFPAVLAAWQGLGYNRRARNLRLCAKEIADKHRGRVPRTEEELLALPGVGQSTAGAVIAFAYNLPAVFIETNIRAAFIHHFFPKRRAVRDRELLPIVRAAADEKNPREWYWALFDYGVRLKETGPDPARRSAQHKRQAPFAGSRRQARGLILKILLAEPRGLGAREIARRIGRTAELTGGVLGELRCEKMIERSGGRYRISR